MTPRRPAIDWLALLSEREGSETEASRVEANPILARRLESLRALVERLGRYRRERPVTADDLAEAAEGRAGAAVLERIEADPELSALLDAVRAAAREPAGQAPGDLPPLPAAVRQRLAEPIGAEPPSTRQRLARTLRALGRSATTAARRAAEIVSAGESAVPVPAASRDLTRVEGGESDDQGPEPGDDGGLDDPVPREDED